MNLNEKQLDAQRRELQERERFIEDKTKLLEEKEKKIQQQLTPSTPQKIYGPPMVPSTTSNPHGMFPTGFQFPGISSQGIFPIGPYDPSALMQPSSPSLRTLNSMHKAYMALQSFLSSQGKTFYIRKFAQMTTKKK